MTINKRLILLAALSACLTLVLASCQQTPSETSGSSSGTLSLLVTDSPFPHEFIAEASVTITKVEVRLANSDEDDGAVDDVDDGAVDDVDDGAVDDVDDGPADDVDDGAVDDVDDTAVDDVDDTAVDDVDDTAVEDVDDGAADDAENGPADGNFIVIFEGEKSFNLLDLRNGRADLLADAEIQSGRYTQVRIYVTEGQVSLSDGRVFALRVPSGESSGIKLNFDFQVDTAARTQLLLDVDLSRAFRAIPVGHVDDVSAIREFTFQPSLSMRLIDLREAGSISGEIRDPAGNPLANVAVTAFNAAGEEVTSTASEADGSYQLSGLPAGSYHVEFSLDGYGTLSVDDIAVEASESGDGDIRNIDDGDVNNVDDGDVNNVDDGDVNNVDDGDVNNIDDGAMDDVDDGATDDADDSDLEDADDGALEDADDGDLDDVDDSAADDVDDGELTVTLSPAAA